VKNKMTRLVGLIIGVLMSSTVAAEGKVVVYNWSEYIPEGLLTDFTKETGIEVEYSTYESNESMYNKVSILEKGGSATYDVIVPSTYYISKMSKEGLLQAIDQSKLSNFQHLDKSLLNKPYDPNNSYSVPYLWGSTGIGINVEDIEYDSVTSWQDLWNSQWKNSLLLTDDVREVFHMALKIKGYSANTRNESEIQQAYELLTSLRPNILLYNSDAPRLPFLAGDVSLGMIWNGSVYQAQEENEAIKYIYPKEGAVFWMDSFAIPKHAANVENAHKFIDFMLRPESAKACVEYVGYATPNLTAKNQLDDDLKQNPVIFPSAEIVEAGEFHGDVGEATAIYEKYWKLLKAGQ